MLKENLWIKRPGDRRDSSVTGRRYYSSFCLETAAAASMPPDAGRGSPARWFPDGNHSGVSIRYVNRFFKQLT